MQIMKKDMSLKWLYEIKIPIPFWRIKNLFKKKK